jgi:hypothetical protein
MMYILSMVLFVASGLTFFLSGMNANSLGGYVLLPVFLGSLFMYLGVCFAMLHEFERVLEIAKNKSVKETNA